MGLTARGNVCPCVGALSTVKSWNHLVMDMGASTMPPRGAAAVSAMVCTQEWGSLPSEKNLGLRACAGLKLQ